MPKKPSTPRTKIEKQKITDAHTEKVTPSVAPPPLAVEEETVSVSTETLETTPVRLMLLLRGIGTQKVVRDALRKCGYTAKEHARGWQLLHGCSGFVEGDDEGTAVTDAIAEIDAWDEPRFAIAEASLRHRHPAQHAFVFRELRASRGVAAVVGVHTFLSRLDALEASPDRVDTRDADHAALATLAARGITPDERARMWALVRTAEMLTDDGGSEAQVVSTAEQTSRLRAARAFYEEWSSITHTLITRRDLLIRLGLAQRKSPAASDEEDAPVKGEPKPA
jgi:hypothetical protein